MTTRFNKLFIFSFVCCLFFMEFKVVCSGIQNSSHLEDIFLYSFLKNQRAIALDNSLNESCNVFSKSTQIYAIQTIDFALSNIDFIITSFKKSNLFYNPKVEATFLKILDYLKDIDHIKPYHLRSFKKTILSFSEYLKKYESSRKNFLNDNDLTLISKIQELNQALAISFFNEKKWKFNFKDRIVDTIIQKPLEVISANRDVVFFVLTTFSIIGLYSLYPYLKKIMDKLFSDKTSNSRSNVFIEDLFQFKAKKQKDGSSCGYFAAAYGVTFGMYQDKKVLSEKLENLSTDLLSDAKKLIKDRRLKIAGENKATQSFLQSINDKYLTENEIRWLLSKDNVQLWKKHFKEDNQRINNVLENIIVLGEFSTLEDNYGYTEDVVDGVYNLRNHGVAQHIILNPNVRNKQNNLANQIDRIGHWYFAKIMKKNDSLDKYNIWVADSLGTQRQKDHFMSRVVDFYTKKDIPSSEMLEIGNLLDGCRHILTTKDILELDNYLGRDERALTELTRIIQLALTGDEKGSFWEQPVFCSFYKSEIESIYSKINKQILRDLHIAEGCESIDSGVKVFLDSSGFDEYVQNICEINRGLDPESRSG